MTSKTTNNLPASVAARLLNRAKQTGDDYQILLTSFCFERFLARLGASAYWENRSRPTQVRAFAKRAGLAVPHPLDENFVKTLGSFLIPILDDLRTGARRHGTWKPGGPWQ